MSKALHAKTPAAGEGWQPAETGQVLFLSAPPRSDLFADPGSGSLRADAVYRLAPVAGDFVLQAKVTPSFKGNYDAAALLVFHNERCWAKLAYEATDFGTRAVVSVITDGTSDDANGPDLNGDSVWLQLVRAGNTFYMHYSEDGAAWRMVRYFALPEQESWRVGICAQAPLGEGGESRFEHLTLQNKSLANPRQGF